MFLQPGEYAVTPSTRPRPCPGADAGGALQVAMFHQVTDGSPGGKMDCHSSSRCAKYPRVRDRSIGAPARSQSHRSSSVAPGLTQQIDLNSGKLSR